MDLAKRFLDLFAELDAIEDTRHREAIFHGVRMEVANRVNCGRADCLLATLQETARMAERQIATSPLIAEQDRIEALRDEEDYVHSLRETVA